MKLTALSQLPVETVSHNRAIKKQVMLRLGDLPHLTNFSQVRFLPRQIAAGHAHEDMHEVFFVESGIGRILVDGVPHDLKPGVCVAVAPKEIHEISNTGDEALVLTYFGLKV